MSKTIIFIRHGKAEEINADITDFERSLVPKGIRLSHVSAKKLAEENLSFDQIFTSPAFRAIETALVFAENLNYNKDKILIKEELYFKTDKASFKVLLETIDNSSNTVLFFGHNPTFTELAFEFSKDFCNNMPKSSVVGLHFDVDSWKDIKQNTGELLFFIRPKELT